MSVVGCLARLFAAAAVANVVVDDDGETAGWTGKKICSGWTVAYSSFATDFFLKYFSAALFLLYYFPFLLNLFLFFFYTNFLQNVGGGCDEDDDSWTMQDVGGRGGGCQPTTRDETFFSDVCTRKEIKMVMVVFRFSSRLLCFKQLFYNN